MLVVPLSLSICNFMMDILTINDQVMLNVENEIPRVGKGLRHLAKLVQVCANGGLALLELVRDIVDDVTEVLDRVQHRVEGGVLQLVNDTTKALPDVLGVAEALDAVRHFGLDRACEHTLEDLAHAEEGEVNVRALHGLEVVHLLVLLVIDLVKKLLPVIVEVEEQLLVVNHLCLSVQKHGSSLAEVFTGVNPLAHTVVMKTLACIFKHIHTVDNQRLVSLKKNLLRVQERLGHSLDLLVVVVVDLSTVVKHITNVRDSKTKLINSLGGLLVRSIPETTHGVLEMLLDWVSI